MHTQIRLSEMAGLSRRNIPKRVGFAAGAMGAIAIAADASSSNNDQQDAGEIVGLWLAVLSAPDNSFPAFKIIEVYGGGGTYTGSGQPDLTSAATSGFKPTNGRTWASVVGGGLLTRVNSLVTWAAAISR